MIRINLLPFRAARKRENIKRQVTVYGLTVALLVVAICYFNFIKLNPELSDLGKKKGQVEKDLKDQQKILKQISKLEKDIEEIRVKLDVIKELEKNKTGPVRLLDELAKSIPKDKLWLTSLTESKGKMTLQGTAMDNETVALFMTNLEKAELITGVDLESTKLKNMPQFKLNVANFIVSCKTYAFKEKTKPTAETTKKSSRRRRAKGKK
ncbi:PilN domain-containing protein [Thermodesulfobacteriota bacterium]